MSRIQLELPYSVKTMYRVHAKAERPEITTTIIEEFNENMSIKYATLKMHFNMSNR